ncbi:DUF1573 domain-containing protein [Catalinimonas niigatensis]|uniref:DUF1573 domain-containing protein n=1 Tax=Catalinimonas niigatensis TaxID=1397264 RepID=UPI0026650442|nr:DUF1573 domain-containing protein [Catalinimonas niigatensis]WPP53089.1 DUF1573 domain-containing protein [Catalinimonas niigatensis]
MERKLLLIPYLIFLSAFAWAQDKKPSVVFETTNHDFGNITEEAGPVSYEFLFTNTGESPLILSDVRPSCGCTTPLWSKEPIAPGDTGTIVAQYNPLNRPGTFRKSITVTSNAETSSMILYIQGIVEPKPKAPADDYPTQLGNLRVKYRSLNMGKVLTKEPTVKSFDVFNASEETLIFSATAVTPDYIAVEVDPKELLPNQKGSIKLTYDAQARKNLGFASDHIRLFTNEAEDSVKEFTVMATIEEYFPPMTEEELKQAPRLTLAKTSHDFGSIQEGKVVKADFTFTNTGRSPLNIRETKANCGCTVSQPEKSTLAPGESSNLTVTFNSSGRRGKQQKIVTIFSNDPKAPTQQISINGRVITSDSDSE